MLAFFQLYSANALLTRFIYKFPFWNKKKHSPLAIESSTGAFSQISVSRGTAHEIWSHVFESHLSYEKKKHGKCRVLSFGGDGGILLLLSKPPPEVSPKFPQTAWRHTKFGATSSNPIFCMKRKSTANAVLFLLAETVGFEPTVPWGTTDFESVPLWPLRYVSVCLIAIELYH